MDKKGDIGLIGLAVMGQNLVLNISDHNYKVVVYNRTTSKVDNFLKNEAAGRDNIIGSYSVRELTEKLKRPRKLMLMVKSGDAVDEFIEQVLPFLEEGDIIIDGGNSLYTDTNRRLKYLESKNILYVGMGVSGGEEGARFGPSIMPGGNEKAWPFIKDIFLSIAAKTDDGKPCCSWVGKEGSGHYVKMIHNGIEYGDLQMICEIYDYLHFGVGLDHDYLHKLFSEWNEGELDSFLIEITRDIMAVKDKDGLPLVTKILDKAGQKGTGKWIAINSFELAMPTTAITEAVYARIISSLKEERVAASKIISGPKENIEGEKSKLIEDARYALYASKIVSYAQGFMLMAEAAKEYKWDLNFGDIASLWRSGCIIRSRFLDKITLAYENNPTLINLLVDPFFIKEIEKSQNGWRETVAKAIKGGIPMPSISSALAFFDSYRRAVLPANLLQAQRDYFGSHTYERIDKPQGEFFHTEWTLN